MKDSNFVFVLDSFHPYVRNKDEEDAKEEEYFFNILSYCYLPLLEMCENLIRNKINFKFAVVFEPTICEMLSDNILRTRYIELLKSKIEFAKQELVRFSDHEKTKKLIQYNLKLFSSDKRFFEDCGGDILKKIDNLSKLGFIEILATTATSCFLPFFADYETAIEAQIEMGRISYGNYFTSVPSGFWIPALAYYSGLDKIIKKYGYDYTIVDSRAFLLSDKKNPTGIFSAAVAENGLKFLAVDACSVQSVCNTEDSFYSNPVYMDPENDVGFTLPENRLKPLFDVSKGRRRIGFRYWSKVSKDSVYDIAAANAQVIEDAKSFVNDRINTLDKIIENSNCNSPISVLTCSCHFLGRTWCEGISWLENVFTNIHHSEKIKAVLPSEAVNISKQLYTINPFFSSCFESGYAAELFTKDSDWMHRHVIYSTEQMIRLAELFKGADNVQERLLNAAAKEVMFMQGFYWPLYAAKPEFTELTEKHFTDYVKSFISVYDALGSDTPDIHWLSRREAEFPLFKDMNYRLFCKK